MTFVLKKSNNYVTFHYFYLANRKKMLKIVPTCSSHHSGSKSTVNFFSKNFSKIFFFAMKIYIFLKSENLILGAGQEHNLGRDNLREIIPS
mgnify:CR=1 FL=1